MSSRNIGRACIASCVGFVCALASAQSGSGGFGQPGQLVPTFQELLWFDAFGIDYESDEDFMLMGPTNDGEAAVGAVWFDSTPEIHVASGVFEEFLYAPILAEPPQISSHVTNFENETQAYTLTVELKAVAGALTGTTGQSFVVSGISYEYSMAFSVPSLGEPIEFRVLVPLWRHKDELSAVLWAEALADPATAILRTLGDDYCQDRYELCVQDADDNYDAALDACDGIDWGAAGMGGGIGGAIGGGIGALVSLFTAGTTAPITIPIGVAIGSALGGTTGEVYSDGDCRHDAFSQYFRDLDACERDYQFCEEYGEWPS